MTLVPFLATTHTEATSSFWRRLELVGDSSNLLQHLVWSKITERELLMGTRSKRRLDVGLELEEDHVADVEGSLGTVLVSIQLHALLSSEKMLANQIKHSGTLSKHGFNIRNR